MWSCGRGLRLAKHDLARASRVLVHCKTTTSNCLISLYTKDYNFPSFIFLTWTSFIEILLQEGSPTFFYKVPRDCHLEVSKNAKSLFKWCFDNHTPSVVSCLIRCCTVCFLFVRTCLQGLVIQLHFVCCSLINDACNNASCTKPGVYQTMVFIHGTWQLLTLPFYLTLMIKVKIITWTAFFV